MPLSISRIWSKTWRWAVLALIAVIEFLWYPVLITLGIWAVLQIPDVFGFANDPKSIAIFGITCTYSVLLWLLWRYAAHIARADLITKCRRIFSFLWLVGFIAYVGTAPNPYTPGGPDEETYIKRMVWIAFIPMGFSIKRIAAENANVWWEERMQRKASEQAARRVPADPQ